MVDVLQDKREAIAELCARYGVARLDVFGSALRDDFRPGESDVDLLVEFGPQERLRPGRRLLRPPRRRFAPCSAPRSTWSWPTPSRNRYIAREIERTKQLLYAA